MNNYEKTKVLTLGNKFIYEAKHFVFENSGGNSFYGTVTGTTAFSIRNSLDIFDNELYVIYRQKNLGELKTGLRFIKWDYIISLPQNSNNTDEPFNHGPEPTKILANQLALSAYWKKTFLKFDLNAECYFSAKKDYSSQF